MRDRYLAVLGLPPGSSEDAIRKAYRKLAKLYHPDVSTHPDAQKKFVAITEAYDYLMRPQTHTYTRPNVRYSPPAQQQRRKTESQQTHRSARSKLKEEFTPEEYARMTLKEFRQTAYFKNTKKQLIDGILSGAGFFTVLVWLLLMRLFYNVGYYIPAVLLFFAPFAFVAWVLLSRPKR